LNKKVIAGLLKELQKEVCSPRTCPAKSYDDCSICNIHKLTNRIMEEASDC